MKKLLFIVAAIIFACMANTTDAKKPSYDKEIKQLQKEMSNQLNELILQLQMNNSSGVERIYAELYENQDKYEALINKISEMNPKADVSSYRKYISDLMKKMGISITRAEGSSKKAMSGEDTTLSSSSENAIASSETATATPVKANPNEEITLTVSSDGPTKDDAVKNALRLAIEQAYGAFVSANTTILNDDLV
ncbi:MAG: hypothetical protein HDS49_01365, partial [Bacteroides sp.]|nr:hypothetical protein [Bacteroides sp.]